MFSSSSTSPEPRRPVRILYADDVRELREIAQVTLVREGHAIDCVPDGVEALEKLAANLGAYDLLITDHHMPLMHGLELVRHLRQLPFKGKIMVFSSELNPAVAAEYQALRVDRILFKPVYPSFLRQAIEELFPSTAVTAPLAG